MPLAYSYILIMVTSHHEASHRIFQDRPELLTPVFDLLGVPLPDQAVIEVLTGDVTEIRPLERRVDSVLRISAPDGGGSFLLAIEAQMRRDPDKAVSWAYYLSYLKAKYDSPALLLVVCQDKATAEWAAGPFRLGLDGWPALTVHPLVVGPGNVPVILDPDEAGANLAMATFSAMTHGRNRDAPAILEALATAMQRADDESVEYYKQMLEIGLGETPARQVWRTLVTVQNYFPGRGTLVDEMAVRYEARGREKGLAEGREEGREEGHSEGLTAGVRQERARAVLNVLAHRNIGVPYEVIERVLECTDLDTLSVWFDRAVVVSSAQEIFAETTH